MCNNLLGTSARTMNSEQRFLLKFFTFRDVHDNFHIPTLINDRREPS